MMFVVGMQLESDSLNSITQNPNGMQKYIFIFFPPHLLSYNTILYTSGTEFKTWKRPDGFRVKPMTNLLSFVEEVCGSLLTPVGRFSFHSDNCMCAPFGFRKTISASSNVNKIQDCTSDALKSGKMSDVSRHNTATRSRNVFISVRTEFPNY